ncbi:MAG: DUF58 domain-containing protein [Bifidobacteriaceae bacterium]|jgi:uncharacterized protein (DUF58 family)|nr:DUF58 domain-containing protein [Bifidobacteriaceae bacterium]
MTTAGPATSVPERLAPERLAPERLLRQLEWQVLRRLDGRLQGAYRTVAYGSSLDFAGLREYTDVDDARRIDWNATARMPQPQVRQFTEDRDLTAWLVLDRSASMAVGRPGRAKHEVLVELALLLARLFGQGGNRVGAVLYDGRQTKIIQPAAGRPQVLRIGQELGSVNAGSVASETLAKSRATRRRRQGKPPLTERAARTDLAALLAAVDAMARRRSLVVLVSDFVGAGLEPTDGQALPWESALLRLTVRHEVACLRIVDPADDELPTAGLILVQDAETGEQLLVDTADPLFRSRLAAQARARSEALGETMRRLGVPFHLVGTGDDLVDVLVRVVTSTKARRR